MPALGSVARAALEMHRRRLSQSMIGSDLGERVMEMQVGRRFLVDRSIGRSADRPIGRLGQRRSLVCWSSVIGNIGHRYSAPAAHTY